MRRYRSSKGYWMIKKPDHPYCHNNGYVPEHRFVFELSIGRYIDPTKEHVHHINGNREDNRLENLQLLSISEHMSLTFTGNQFAKGHRNNGGFGRKHTEESKLKNRLAHLGRRHSNETKEKLSKLWKDRKHTEESKKRMSEARKLWWERNRVPA